MEVHTMKPFNSALCAGFFASVMAAPSHAAPITDQSLIQVRQLENTFNGNTNSLENFTTTNNSVSHTLDTTGGAGSIVKAHGSLVTGKTGTLATTSTDPDINNTSSSIMLFDTLSFSSALPTSVSYGVNFDGSISNRNVFGAGTASTTVKIYDITGLSTWLTETPIDSPTDTFIFSTAPIVSETSVNFFVGAQNIVDTLPPSFDQAIANTDGTVFDFDLNKTGTFIADPTKTYGISIWTQSGASGLGSSSDFLNTSAFSFTDLNGATFSSGSGVFLSAAVSTPSVPALLGIGIIAGWLCRRSRRIEDRKPCPA